jgi:hypothetical protein
MGQASALKSRTCVMRAGDLMDENDPSVPRAPSFEEVVEFLNEKAPGFACLVCKSRAMDIVRERPIKGRRFRPSITLVGPHGPFQEYAFYTSCTNCGAVQMFDLRAFRRWKQRKGEQGP